MHKQDAIYLDQLCPKISNKSWRESLYKITPGNPKIKICQATLISLPKDL